MLFRDNGSLISLKSKLENVKNEREFVGFEPVHRGAFLNIFVRISTDKENTWIFVNFSDQLGEILKDSCYFWRFLEIFGLKVWNFSTLINHLDQSHKRELRTLAPSSIHYSVYYS